MLVGAGLTRRLFWPTQGRPLARLAGAALGAALFIGGQIALAWLTLGQILDSVGGSDIVDFLRETRNGEWLLWAMGAAIVMVALELVPSPTRAVGMVIDRMVYAACALALVGGLSLNSHAGAMAGMAEWYDPRGGIWPLVAQVMHGIAVALWGGPLLYLAWSRPSAAERADYVEALRRFSTAALPAVCVFVSSGAYLGCIHLDAPTQLVSSFYGQMLSVKAVAVGLLLGLALHNRRLLRLADGGAALRRLRRAMQLETGVLLLVLIVTNALASADPPHLHAVRDQMQTMDGRR